MRTNMLECRQDILEDRVGGRTTPPDGHKSVDRADGRNLADLVVGETRGGEILV